MKNILLVTAVLSMSALGVGCSSIKGTVYEQSDGSYKATYSANTESKVRKTIHTDAQLTCKKQQGAKNIAVVEETVENIEDDSKKEGFAAVAGNAVSLAGKFYGAESVRGELIFNCKKT